jgi:hypothetical protein
LTVKLHSFLSAAAVAVLLAGCANKYDVVTPELQASMMADLQAGKLNLDCGPKCSLTWMSQAPSIHALDLAENWNGLAVRVMQIGFGSDLAYYYLGQSAQGLGYHNAAIAYYSTSYAIAQGGNPLLKCSAQQSPNGDPCLGVDLVSSIPVLIQASRDAIAQQQAAAAAASASADPPVVKHHRKKPAATTASTGSSGWVAPPPAASSATPTSGTPAAWVAPPPAAQ